MAVIGLSAQTSHYQLKLNDFHELKVVDGVNVDYVCDASRAGLIEFDANVSVASAVIFEPSKQKLEIKLASRDSVYTSLPTVKVYSSFLSKLNNEGDSLVRVLSMAPEAKFQCRVMGNGSISLRNVKVNELKASIIAGHGTIAVFGTATTATFKVTGAGHIQADDLQATDVSATVTGTGAINCYATGQLSVGGVGSGKIFYRGRPEIKKSFLSKVKLIPLDE